MSEPPWAVLADQLRKGTIIPFLGAGASSYNAGPANPVPPSGSDFARELAERAEIDISCTSQECRRALFDLARVTSYYQSCVDTRPNLDQLIRERICSNSFQPSPLHQLLAQIAQERNLLIITTNYDSLLERAFDDVVRLGGRLSYDVVATSADELSYEDTDDAEAPEHAGAVWLRRGGSDHFEPKLPSEIEIDLDERSVIYKIHGSVGDNGWEGGFLIAEEDYARFLGRMQEGLIPDAILGLMRSKKKIQFGPRTRTVPVYSLLFLGYGMNDWNLRVLLQELRIGSQSIGVERHYAIMRTPNPIDRMLLEKRGISTFDCDLHRFVDELKKEWMGHE